ncbi:MAG: hypothetical protein PQJ50_16195 [Spirochaetales bacterium]|nr:hypothetical protein [Spirochaetales bacterium]
MTQLLTTPVFGIKVKFHFILLALMLAGSLPLWSQDFNGPARLSHIEISYPLYTAEETLEFNYDSAGRMVRMITHNEAYGEVYTNVFAELEYSKGRAPQTVFLKGYSDIGPALRMTFEYEQKDRIHTVVNGTESPLYEEYFYDSDNRISRVEWLSDTLAGKQLYSYSGDDLTEVDLTFTVKSYGDYQDRYEASYDSHGRILSLHGSSISPYIDEESLYYFHYNNEGWLSGFTENDDERIRHRNWFSFNPESGRLETIVISKGDETEIIANLYYEEGTPHYPFTQYYRTIDLLSCFLPEEVINEWILLFLIRHYGQ